MISIKDYEIPTMSYLLDLISEVKINSSIPTLDKLEPRSVLSKPPSDDSFILGFLKIGSRFILRLVETFQETLED